MALVRRKLVVSIDCDLLALAVLHPSIQFGCAEAEFWDNTRSKSTFDSSVQNLPIVLLFLLFCRCCLQAGGKEHGIRVKVEITMIYRQ